jgi:hypothetical protein
VVSLDGSVAQLDHPAVIRLLVPDGFYNFMSRLTSAVCSDVWRLLVT